MKEKGRTNFNKEIEEKEPEKKEREEEEEAKKENEIETENRGGIFSYANIRKRIYYF